MNNNFNISNTTSSNDSLISGFRFITYIIEIILASEIIIFNTINIIIIIFYIKRKTLTSILFLSMSITDLFVGTISIPGDILNGYGYFTSLKPICIFHKVFDYGSSTLSLFLLFLITTHRVLQLKYPLKYNDKMNRWRWTFILAVWFINYSTWLILWIVYYNKEENRSACHFRNLFIYIYIYYIFLMTISYFLIIIMNMFMIRLFMFIKKLRILNEDNTKSYKKEDKSIYCVISITVNLVICWTSFIFLWPIVKHCKNCISSDFYVVSYLASYCFSGLNPLILLYFNKNYRLVFLRKILHLKCLIKNLDQSN